VFDRSRGRAFEEGGFAEAELQTIWNDVATSPSARDRASVLSRCEAALRALREELLALEEDKAHADEVATASRGDLGSVLGQLQEKKECRATAAAQVRDLQRHLSELAAERDRLATACESAAREQHAVRDRVGELQAERAGLLTKAGRVKVHSNHESRRAGEAGEPAVVTVGGAVSREGPCKGIGEGQRSARRGGTQREAAGGGCVGSGGEIRSGAGGGRVAAALAEKHAAAPRVVDAAAGRLAPGA
jgi:hypothetical protein